MFNSQARNWIRNEGYGEIYRGRLLAKLGWRRWGVDHSGYRDFKSREDARKYVRLQEAYHAIEEGGEE